MSDTSHRSRMPAFGNNVMQDETRAMIRARIECLLTSGAVASQVSHRLTTRGCLSPWAEPQGPLAEPANSPHGHRPERIKQGSAGWRSSSSRPE